MKGYYYLLFSLLFSVPVLAQDCNSVYQNGLDLMKKRNEASVREAVRKFESARRCYKVNRDDAGLKNCEEKITECNRLLGTFSNKVSSSEKELQFPAAGGEDVVAITTRGNWSFSGNSDWCLAEKDKGQLIVTVGANDKTIRRSQIITVKTQGKQQLIKVIQEGCEERLSVSENDLFFTSDGDEKMIEISSNNEWNIKNFPSWCSVRKDQKHLYLKPTANDSADNRSAIILITAGSRSVDLRIVQEAEKFKVNSENIVFEGKGGSMDVPVVNGGSLWEVTSCPDWCKASRNGDQFLRLECKSNKTKTIRSGIVRLKKGSRSFELSVAQEGKGSVINGLFGNSKKDVNKEEKEKSNLNGIFGKKKEE